MCMCTRRLAGWHADGMRVDAVVLVPVQSAVSPLRSPSALRPFVPSPCEARTHGSQCRNNYVWLDAGVLEAAYVNVNVNVNNMWGSAWAVGSAQQATAELHPCRACMSMRGCAVAHAARDCVV